MANGKTNGTTSGWYGFGKTAALLHLLVGMFHPARLRLGGPEGFERAFRNLRDEDYARCFPRVIRFMNDASARAEANRQRDIADQARKAEQARAAAQAKHEADLVDKAREANEARKAAEIAGQQARETHQRDLEIRAAQAEQAKALAEAAKKRAAEAAALDQQRQQADAERLQAEGQIAKIEADALARKRAEEEAARDRAGAARKQAGAEQRAQAEREAAKPQPQPPKRKKTKRKKRGLNRFVLHAVRQLVKSILIGSTKRWASSASSRSRSCVTTCAGRFLWTMMELPFLLRFTRWSKSVANDGTITMRGDQAEAQNGLGNWMRVTYSCTVNIDTKTVTDASLDNGRLN